jgi:hypothetical protein
MPFGHLFCDRELREHASRHALPYRLGGFRAKGYGAAVFRTVWAVFGRKVTVPPPSVPSGPFSGERLRRRASVTPLGFFGRNVTGTTISVTFGHVFRVKAHSTSVTFGAFRTSSYGLAHNPRSSPNLRTAFSDKGYGTARDLHSFDRTTASRVCAPPRRTARPLRLDRSFRRSRGQISMSLIGTLSLVRKNALTNMREELAPPTLGMYKAST